MIKSGHAKVAIALISIAAILCLASFGFHVRARRFQERADDATNNIAEAVDKLTSDVAVFDMADDRAVASIQQLKDAAYTDRQREGAVALAVIIGTLRVCRTTRELPGDKFQVCLESVQKSTAEAYKELGIP